MTGLSRANLYSMRSFAEAWPATPIVQQPVGRLGWGQVVDLLAKLDDRAARDWYAAAADAGGWTRDVLANQMLARALTTPRRLTEAVAPGPKTLRDPVARALGGARPETYRRNPARKHLL